VMATMKFQNRERTGSPRGQSAWVVDATGPGNLSDGKFDPLAIARGSDPHARDRMLYSDLENG